MTTLIIIGIIGFILLLFGMGFVAMLLIVGLQVGIICGIGWGIYHISQNGLPDAVVKILSLFF